MVLIARVSRSVLGSSSICLNTINEPYASHCASQMPHILLVVVSASIHGYRNSILSCSRLLIPMFNDFSTLHRYCVQQKFL